MKESVMIDSTFAIIDRHLMVKMPREVDHHNAAGIREQADFYIMEDAADHVIFDFETSHTLSPIIVLPRKRAVIDV